MKWHQIVPKDLKKNLLFRKKIVQAAKDDRAVQQGLVEICKRDVLFFINTFCYQLNPNADDERMTDPFITWPFQDEAVKKLLSVIRRRKQARWQKSREMGASWLALFLAVHGAAFHENYRVSVISRTKEAVDDPADSDSLFWKVDYFLARMPDWLIGPFDRVGMAFNFLRTGGQIVGEANTQDAFIGGRARWVLYDEFGRFKNGERIYTHTKDVSKCRIFVGTHHTTQNFFYDLCFDEKYRNMEEVVTHWTQHPDKKKGLYRYDEKTGKIEILDHENPPPADYEFRHTTDPQGGPFPGLRSPWYDEECDARPAHGVKMDLDIDPRGASRQFFEESIIKRFKNEAPAPLWAGELECDKETGEPLRLVESSEGRLRLWVKPISLDPPVVPPDDYGFGADVATGSGATPSCLSGMNSRAETVLAFSDPLIFDTDFAILSVAVCKLFMNDRGSAAIVAWEKQGSGAYKRMIVDLLGFRRVYYRHNYDKTGNPQYDGEPGVATNDRTMLMMFSEYRDALYKRDCVNRNWQSLDEHLNFEYTPKGVKYRARGSLDDASAEGVHHGDPVVADVLAYMVVSRYAKKRKEKEREEEERPNPMTFAGREKLAAQEQEEEEIVWL